MDIQAVNLPSAIIERAKELTGKRTARAAVVALVEEAGNVPNAETVKVLRSKEKVHFFERRGDAVAHYRKLLK